MHTGLIHLRYTQRQSTTGLAASDLSRLLLRPGARNIDATSRASAVGRARSVRGCTANVSSMSTGSTGVRPTSRWRSSRPPVDWSPSTGRNAGTVKLPSHLYWSDDNNEFDLSDTAERDLLYRIVLAEGTEEDVRRYLHLSTLLRIWDELWLPPAVHEAWDAWVEAHRRAAV